MDDAEFRRLNERRQDLIEKQSAGFTEEEMHRPLAVPGWKEECARREREALTPAEHEELAGLEKIVSAELNRRHPVPTLPDLPAEHEDARAWAARSLKNLRAYFESEETGTD